MENIIIIIQISCLVLSAGFSIFCFSNFIEYCLNGDVDFSLENAMTLGVPLLVVVMVLSAIVLLN